MTRKHFIDMADTICELYMSGHIRGSKFRVMEKELMGFCKRNGSNFDSGRFQSYIDKKLTPYGTGDEIRGL